MPRSEKFLYEIRSAYDIADFHFYVLETPGHSAGGVSIVFPEDHLVLSGDALFRETIGRTDLPTGNAAQLLSSIKEELFPLPSSYTVYPGHGPETSIGHEKMFNPFMEGFWGMLKRERYYTRKFTSRKAVPSTIVCRRWWAEWLPSSTTVPTSNGTRSRCASAGY